MQLWLSSWQGMEVQRGVDWPSRQFWNPRASSLEPRLGSKYNPEGARGNLLLGRVEELHSLEKMVLYGLTLEDEDEIKTVGIVLLRLAVGCQDARFCHALIYLGGILFCQILASKQYLTLCHVCGHRPVEDGPEEMLEGGTN